MAWHSGKPADSDFLSVSVQHIRENFAELEPLQPHIAELIDLTTLRPHVAELVDLTALQPHIAALLDSRIVEMGSNANGTYVRWENGLQVCWGNHSFGTVLAGASVEATWTYPSSFASTPIVSIASNHDGSASHKAAFRHGAQPGMSSATVATANATSIDRFCLAALIAIGRWK